MTPHPQKHWGRCAAVTFAILLLPSLSLRAALIEQIQSVTVAANSIGNAFDVTLQNTGPAAVSIAGFAFGLQANTTNITFTSVTTGTTISPYIFNGQSLFGPNITTSSGSSVTASDLYALIGSSITLAPGATLGLGHVFFNAGALGGLTNLSFQVPNTSLTDANGNNIPINTLGTGTIMVTGGAVPEGGASTFALLLVGLAAVTMSRALLGKTKSIV